MKKFKTKHLCILLSGLILMSSVGCTSAKTDLSSKVPTAIKPTMSPYEAVKVGDVTLLRGMNLSALEGQGKPASFINDTETYTELAERGFDHIRLPVDFRNFADKKGKLDDSKMQTVDNAIKLANEAGMTVILDFHGWYNLNVSKGDDKLFLTIWENVAKRYRKYPDSNLLFELINEPHTTEGGDLYASNLNDLQRRAIKLIRKTNPTRVIVYAPAEWNGSWMLYVTEVPQDDPNIIIAVHTYATMEFTHQGCTWWNENATEQVKLTDEIMSKLDEQLDATIEYAKWSKHKIILNEFGVNVSMADKGDIKKYLSHITTKLENSGIAWTYWSYSGDFGVVKFGWFGSVNWHDNVIDALMSARK